MSNFSPQKTRFYGYPESKQAPDRIYKNEKKENPVLRGLPLQWGSWVLCKLQFIQAYLWSNADFGLLRNIPQLSDYNPRFDPTVIPISLDAAPPTTTGTDAKSFLSLGKGLTGRYHSLADFHALYLSGEITPLSIAQALLPLIRRDINPSGKHSTAFIDSKIELVLKAAQESTARYKSGNPLGILDGVPIAVKDEVDVAGYRSYHGRKKDDELFPIKTESPWPVQMWQDSGAVIIGKTNMHELGTDTTGNNPHWGTPRNPFNNAYYPGGSSGGSAYAVATGLVPFALASDAGGSIRIPAAFCGVYGLKPSHGRVGESSLTMLVSGPIAATISDLEVAFAVMATPDPNHPVRSLFSVPHRPTSPPSKALGIFEPWFARADPAVQTACRNTIDYLVKTHGYHTVAIDIPFIPEGQLAHAMTTLAEMAGKLHTTFPTRHWLADLSAPAALLASVGGQTSARDYLLAQRMRSLLMSHIAFLFKTHPGLLIVTPTVPFAGWEIHDTDLAYGVNDGNTTLRSGEYIWLANFTGVPALTCPVGYVAAGKGSGDLPVGLMAMAEWGSDEVLLEWGRDVERWLVEEYPGGRKRPGEWEDVMKLAGQAK